MADTRKRIRICADVSEDDHQRYLRVMGNDTHGQCMHKLLDTYDASHDTTITVTPETILDLLNCTMAERAEINDAIALNNLDGWQLLHNGFMREVRIHNTQAKKLPHVDFESMDATGRGKKNRLRGSTDLRIKRCIEDLMQHNVAQTHHMDVIYITKGIVQDATKAQSDYVADYFERHKDELDAHHQSLGIGSHEAGVHHNRMRSRYLREQAKRNGAGRVPLGEQTKVTADTENEENGTF